MITIPGKLVNKANTYEIHKNAAGESWIAPSKAAKAFQEFAAWCVLRDERREWIHNEPLEMTIRLVNQRTDVDAIKAVLDAVQQSGRITNDKQIRKMTVVHVPGRSPSLELEIEPFSAAPEKEEP